MITTTFVKSEKESVTYEFDVGQTVFAEVANRLTPAEVFMRAFWGTESACLISREIEIDSVKEAWIVITFCAESKEESERVRWCFERIAVQLCEDQEFERS
ncbi:MAG: hypothetical protein AAF939_01250 [Planctomycetota bacterium]